MEMATMYPEQRPISGSYTDHDPNTSKMMERAIVKLLLGPLAICTLSVPE